MCHRVTAFGLCRDTQNRAASSYGILIRRFQLNLFENRLTYFSRGIARSGFGRG